MDAARRRYLRRFETVALVVVGALIAVIVGLLVVIVLSSGAAAHVDGQPLTIVDPDIETPQTDAQIADRMCGAFMQHPRLSAKLTNCFSHIEGGDLDVYGRALSEKDLGDLCTSVAGKPMPGGNISIAAHNEDGSTVSARCQARGFVRRVPIDDSGRKD